MRYAIHTKDISKEKPSKEEIARNIRISREEELIGLHAVYDSGYFIDQKRIKLKEFESFNDYYDALSQAELLLTDYKPIPEPLRTKLIKEAANIKKQEEYQARINEEKWQREIQELEGKYKRGK